MIEDDIHDQVYARLKELLLDQSINYYKNYESFYSRTNHCYQFLIWKLMPENLDDFSKEIQRLIEQEGHECIPGIWDISTFDPNKKTGYKVTALHKVSI
ncbi:MAG: hypothetical protein JO149_01870 [Gammaproteobacteria bacterium]|nr:hypothetical protein [Gammaproteobacteria bacterium]